MSRPTRRVIGVGSPHGDDRVGWLVVAALRATRPPPDWELVALDRPGAALLADLREASQVVLVDAMRSGMTVGRVRVLEPDEYLRRSTGTLAVHGFGVGEALALAMSLGGLPPSLRVVGIEISATEAGGEPQPAVLDAIAPAAALVRQLLGTPDPS